MNSEGLIATAFGNKYHETFLETNFKLHMTMSFPKWKKANNVIAVIEEKCANNDQLAGLLKELKENLIGGVEKKVLTSASDDLNESLNDFESMMDEIGVKTVKHKEKTGLLFLCSCFYFILFHFSLKNVS